MKLNSRKILVWTSLVVGVSVLFWVFFNTNNVNSGDFSRISSVRINNSHFSLELADTDEKRAKGLSGRDSLSLEKGMLFIYDVSGYYPFWMKDMNFPIDILWINENMEIVFIMNQVQPETYPEAYVSSQKALYVLEFAGGVVESLNIDVGDKVYFK